MKTMDFQVPESVLAARLALFRGPVGPVAPGPYSWRKTTTPRARRVLGRQRANVRTERSVASSSVVHERFVPPMNVSEIVSVLNPHVQTSAKLRLALRADSRRHLVERAPGLRVLGSPTDMRLPAPDDDIAVARLQFDHPR